MTLIALSFAEDNWTIDAVDLVRWPGAAEDNPVVASVEAETQVEVVYVDGDRVRVRTGQDFGWTDASSLSAEAPAGGLLEGLEIAPPSVPF